MTDDGGTGQAQVGQDQTDEELTSEELEQRRLQEQREEQEQATLRGEELQEQQDQEQQPDVDDETQRLGVKQVGEGEMYGTETSVHNSENPQELISEDNPSPHERVRTAWEEPNVGTEEVSGEVRPGWGDPAPDEPEEQDPYANRASYGSSLDEAMDQAQLGEADDLRLRDEQWGDAKKPGSE